MANQKVMQNSSITSGKITGTGTASIENFTGSTGGAGSELSVTLLPPDNNAFSIIDSSRNITLKGGESREVTLEIHVAGDPAAYEKQLSAVLPLRSTDPDITSGGVPLTAFVKGP